MSTRAKEEKGRSTFQDCKLPIWRTLNIACVNTPVKDTNPDKVSYEAFKVQAE